MASLPKNETIAQISDRILSELRTIAAYCQCRIDVSSDMDGALGALCVTASTPDREKQGFGGSIEEAVHNLRTQPVRRSSGKA